MSAMAESSSFTRAWKALRCTPSSRPARSLNQPKSQRPPEKHPPRSPPRRPRQLREQPRSRRHRGCSSLHNRIPAGNQKPRRLCFGMNLRGFRLVGYSLGLLCFSWTAISSRAAAPTPASPVKFPDNQGLRQVRSLMLPKLSPDGNSVLVQVADSTADGGKSHLWLVDIGHKAHRQLTFSPAGPVGSPTASKPGLGEFAGSWMPDGSAVLFLSHRGEHTQLYRLPMDGGEASPYDLKIIPPVDESKRPDAVP